MLTSPSRLSPAEYAPCTHLSASLRSARTYRRARTDDAGLGSSARSGSGRTRANDTAAVAAAAVNDVARTQTRRHPFPHIEEQRPQ
jgi:hypothetical protein